MKNSYIDVDSSEQSMANNDHSDGSMISHTDNSNREKKLNKCMTMQICVFLVEGTSDRVYFSLDVQPMQKPIYRSDEFGIRPRQTRGFIACVQGKKDSSQQRRQVLPKIRVIMTDVLQLVQ